MTIFGEGFQSANSSNATVRFACQKGHIEVSGNVISDTEVIFETPNFEKYGPVDVEARVKLGSKSLTNGTVDFSFFSVTDSTKSLAFGPGLLNGIAAGFPTSFVIQAKDRTGADRICGMDEFCVTITELDIIKSVEEVEDEGDDAEDHEEVRELATCFIIN